MKINKKTIIIISILLVLIVGGGVTTVLLKGNKSEDKYPEYVKHIKVDNKFFEGMTEKELLMYKVLNSIDFYKNVSGTYNNFNSDEGEVHYYVDNEKKRTYIKSNLYEVLVKDNNVVSMEYGRHKVSEFAVNDVVDEYIPKLKVKDRIDDEEQFIGRVDTEYLQQARTTLLNEEEGAYLLRNIGNWEIEWCTYLERDAAKIESKMEFESKDGIEKVVYIVDKETGIILEHRRLDKNNNTIYGFETTEIKVDKGIADEVFDKKLE